MISRVFTRVQQRLWAVGLGAALVWIVLALPVVFVRGADVRTLADWLGGVVDFSWGSVPLMLGLLLAAIAWKIWRNDPMLADERGHAAWLGGFVVSLLLFLAAIRVESRNLAALSLPLMAACGIGWMAGVAGLRRFWIPVLLLLLALPPPLLASRYWHLRLMAQELMGVDEVVPLGTIFSRWVGPAVEFEWRMAIYKLAGFLPNPIHVVFITALICWLIPERIWLKLPLLALGIFVAFLEMSLNKGC